MCRQYKLKLVYIFLMVQRLLILEFTEKEQKMSTTARELCGVVSALQSYKHYIIGSPHPVYSYKAHKTLLYL